MNTRETSRSARRNKYPNTLVLHYCKACSAKWENPNKQNRCPSCKYVVPKHIDDKTFKVIETTRVNTRDGRIVCHVKKD